MSRETWWKKAWEWKTKSLPSITLSFSAHKSKSRRQYSMMKHVHVHIREGTLYFPSLVVFVMDVVRCGVEVTIPRLQNNIFTIASQNSTASSISDSRRPDNCLLRCVSGPTCRDSIGDKGWWQSLHEDEIHTVKIRSYTSSLHHRGLHCRWKGRHLCAEWYEDNSRDLRQSSGFN